MAAISFVGVLVGPSSACASLFALKLVAGELERMAVLGHGTNGLLRRPARKPGLDLQGYGHFRSDLPVDSKGMEGAILADPASGLSASATISRSWPGKPISWLAP